MEPGKKERERNGGGGGREGGGQQRAARLLQVARIDQGPGDRSAARR